MPDPDRDTEPEPTTDPRFDDWPVQHDAASADWPVERSVPGEDDAAPERVEDLEWLGFVGGGSNVVRPVLYEPETPAVVTGELDEANERIVLGEDHERHELESDDSLGEQIVAFGEEHGWTWLSSFARTYLEDDDAAVRDGPTLEHTEFHRRNLADSASQDVAFFGSHTFTDATDRVFTLEREFDVFREGSGEGVVVAVDEELLVAEEPREKERAGDAQIVDEYGYEFAVDVDPDDPNWENRLEGTLNEWHTNNVGPPTDG